MKNAFVALVLAMAAGCGGGSSGSSKGSTGTTSGTTGSTGTSACNLQIQGATSNGTFGLCTAAQAVDGSSILTLGGQQLSGCPSGQSCLLSVQVPLASGTFHCETGDAVVTYEQAPTDGSGGQVSAAQCTGDKSTGDCPADHVTHADNTNGTTCTVVVTSFVLQGGSAAPYGHFTGSITAHLKSPVGASGPTLDISTTGGW